jgi:hypothetical protein
MQVHVRTRLVLHVHTEETIVVEGVVRVTVRNLRSYDSNTFKNPAAIGRGVFE